MCCRSLALAGFNLDFNTRPSSKYCGRCRIMSRALRLASGSGMRRTKSKRCAVAYMHTKKLSKDIECVQKRCLKVLFPALLYTESLTECGLERLDDRRDMITQSMFRQIKDPKHPLRYLLPPVKVSHSQMVLRPTYPYKSH